MNLSPEWVPFFQSAGLDAVHWSTIGKATAPDIEILNRAREHQDVIVT